MNNLDFIDFSHTFNNQLKRQSTFYLYGWLESLNLQGEYEKKEKSIIAKICKKIAKECKADTSYGFNNFTIPRYETDDFRNAMIEIMRESDTSVTAASIIAKDMYNLYCNVGNKRMIDTTITTLQIGDDTKKIGDIVVRDILLTLTDSNAERTSNMAIDKGKIELDNLLTATTIDDFKYIDRFGNSIMKHILIGVDHAYVSVMHNGIAFDA